MDSFFMPISSVPPEDPAFGVTLSTRALSPAETCSERAVVRKLGEFHVGYAVFPLILMV